MSKKKNAGARPKGTPADQERSTTSRRQFLGRFATTAAVVAITEGALGSKRAQAAPANNASGSSAAAPPPPPPGTYAPLGANKLAARKTAAYQMRVSRAQAWNSQPVVTNLANNDGPSYPTGWAQNSRALPHDALGHPNPAAWEAFVHACITGNPADFAAVPLGGVQPIRNPQSGLCFETMGLDTHATFVPPAPAFASAWRAAEMVEVYWASLLRDVPFANYNSDPLVAQACADLSALSDYRGPLQGGAVTPDVLFRGPWPGSIGGPFISQFLLKDIAFGAQINTQQVRVFAPGSDFLTNYGDWLARQNGQPWGPRVYDGTRRYMRNARDLATWVDADPPLQAAYHALSILLQMHAPIDPSNPYAGAITNQDGFTTFGPVEWFDLIGRAPRVAHEAVWFHKFRIHRVLRPEEFGGRVHNHVTNAFSYPIHSDMLNSSVLAANYSRFGSYLCSQAYPDGAPTHCAYPSGHSVGAGSTVTMLKAIFDENFVIPNPVEAAPDGLSLVPYVGPPLTVGGELNKLAFNIGIARVLGGIHWRSDVMEGNRLGEQTSVGLLTDMKAGYNEPFTGYHISKLDGTPIVI